MRAARNLGLLHQGHPLLGELVVDTTHGLVGRLRAVCTEPSEKARAAMRPTPGDGSPVAWLAPPDGGGREWTTPVERIKKAKP